jgi:hypothetical protein
MRWPCRAAPDGFAVCRDAAVPDRARASAPQQDDRRPCVAGACQPKAGAPETYWVACRERLHASVAHALRWRHLDNEKGVDPCLLRELPAARPRPPRSPHSRWPCPGPGDDDTNTAPSKPTTSDNPPKNHEDHELQLEILVSSCSHAVTFPASVDPAAALVVMARVSRPVRMDLLPASLRSARYVLHCSGQPDL